MHVHTWYAVPRHLLHTSHTHSDLKGCHYLMHSNTYVMLSACVPACVRVYMCVHLSARLIIPPRASAVAQGYILASNNCQGQKTGLWSQLRLLSMLSYWSAALLTVRKYCRKKRSRAVWRLSEEDFFHYNVTVKQGLFHLRSRRHKPSAQEQAKWGWGSE